MAVATNPLLKSIRVAFDRGSLEPDRTVRLQRNLVESKAAGSPEKKCGLYLAESSIPNAGLGLYTGVDVPLGSTIGPSDVVIQHYDHKKHQEMRRLKHGINETDDPVWLLEEYYWDPRTTRGKYDSHRVHSFVPGVGMLTNCHPGLTNALFRQPKIDAAGLHRSSDAGAGAFSEFHDYRYVARHGEDGDGDGPGLVGGKIPKGMEVFTAYGDSWFKVREKKLGVIPLSGDFAQADELLQNFTNLVDQTVNQTDDWPAGVLNELWNSTLMKLPSRDERLQLALPDTGEVALRAQQTFGSGAAAMLTAPNVVRSIEWLEENGSCLDNMNAGRSTVKQAGRGAFATRAIRAGEVVAPAPVAHILRDHLHMYTRLSSEKGKEGRIVQTGEQLMLNYCYGHPESSLLLFPQSPVVNFINHDGKRPNVYLRWSSLANHHAEWLDRPVQSIAQEKHAGLIMEFVALQDIQEGEEIFATYGRRWEQAWSKHVETWEPAENSTSYVSAAMLNDENYLMRTEEEQKAMPYPGNVKIMCYGIRIGKGSSMWQDSPWLTQYADKSRPCKIIRRYNAESNSTSLTEAGGSSRVLYEVQMMAGVRGYGVTRDVPREAIEFVDREHTRDQFLENSFRHEMEVPKGFFPKLWMDLKT